MQKPKIDQYFAKKGISVYYNTLGMTEDLVRAYVTAFRPVLEKKGVVSSHLVKQACYETLYQIEPRLKMTGFEQVETQDRAFREKIVSYITDVFYGPVLNVEQTSQSDHDYKTLLVDTLKSVDLPVLYFSGGIDSELVANALIDAEKTFKPVLFLWLDQNHNVINQYEANFARDFCKSKGLELEEYKIDVESLWLSSEFFEFAKDIQIHSTHVLTHAWAVKLLSEKYPTSTHLFGGEVRFTRSVNDDNQLVDIVFLAKVNPPGYDQSNAYTVFSFSPSGCGIVLYYDQTGTWTIDRFGGVGGVTPGPLTGTWTTTPASNYEISTNGGFSWFPIVGNTVIGGVGVGGGSGETNSITIPMILRVVSDSGNTVVSQLNLQADSF